MRLITIEKVWQGMMLPKSWICLVFWSMLRSNSRVIAIGFSFYIPWIFHGPYYDPMRNLDRYGWRIPRVLFEIGFSRPLFRKFFWCEAI